MTPRMIRAWSNAPGDDIPKISRGTTRQIVAPVDPWTCRMVRHVSVVEGMSAQACAAKYMLAGVLAAYPDGVPIPTEEQLASAALARTNGVNLNTPRGEAWLGRILEDLKRDLGFWIEAPADAEAQTKGAEAQDAPGAPAEASDGKG